VIIYDTTIKHRISHCIRGKQIRFEIALLTKIYVCLTFCSICSIYLVHNLFWFLFVFLYNDKGLALPDVWYSFFHRRMLEYMLYVCRDEHIVGNQVYNMSVSVLI